MSLIFDILKVAKVRLEAITVANGYSADVGPVVLPKKKNNPTPVDRMVTVRMGDMEPSPENDRPGNPPAIAYKLPIVIRCIVIPSDLGTPDPIEKTATNFATEAQRAIAAPADWHQFGGNAINADIGPVMMMDVDDESPSGAMFAVEVLYRVSELDPNEVRA